MTALDAGPAQAQGRPAVARVGAPGTHTRQANPRPVTVAWPPRPPRRVAGIPTGLLVCWQAAMVPALVAIGRPAGQVVVLGIVAAAVVAVTGCRPRGRWVHEWAMLWLRYLARGAQAAAPRHPAPELALLDLAVRTETIGDVQIEGHDVAAISHAYGCTAVLELDPGALTADLPWLPLTVAPPHEPDGPAVSVQLLLHATPSATAAPVRAWLAVQVRRDPGYPTDELRRALVSAVRRLRRRLRSALVAGVDAQVLDQTRLRHALHTLTGLELTAPVTPGVADPVGAEQWRAWWTRSVPHETLLVRSWSGLPGPPDPELFEALLRPRCPQTVSVAARRLRLPFAYGAARAGEEVLAIELMVRLAERDGPALDRAARQLRDQLAAVGVRVERLDGRQLPALAGTLPVGGFLPGYAPSTGAAAPPAHPRRRPNQPVVSRAATGQPAVAPAGPAAPTAPAWPNPPAPPTRAPVPAPPPVPLPADPTTAALSAPTALEVPTAPLKVPGARPHVAIAQVHVPQLTPTHPTPVPVAPPESVRGAASVPTSPGAMAPPDAPASPPPAGPASPPPAGPASPPPAGPTSSPPAGPASSPPAGPASSPPAGPTSSPPAGPTSPPPAAPTSPRPARGQARVTAPPTQATPPTSAASAMPVRGHATVPVPAPPPPQSGSEPPAPPDPHRAVRAYGASLFTTESTRRPYVEQLLALVRTRQRSAQVVSIISGASGFGASVTAAGLARTLATLREDHVALLRVGVDPLDPATIQAVCREHAFAVIDVGAHVGEGTAQALAASTRVVVVTGADRRATTTTRLTLDRIHQVHPALVADAAIAVVCRSGREHRRVSRGLSDDRSPQAARIVPVPTDPALAKMDQVDQVDLTRLRMPTREAYLRLAAAVSAATGAEPSTADVSPYTANLHP